MPELPSFASALADMRTVSANRLPAEVPAADLIWLCCATLVLSHSQQLCCLRLTWNCNFRKEAFSFLLFLKAYLSMSTKKSLSETNFSMQWWQFELQIIKSLFCCLHQLLYFQLQSWWNGLSLFTVRVWFFFFNFWINLLFYKSSAPGICEGSVQCDSHARGVFSLPFCLGAVLRQLPAQQLKSWCPLLLMIYSLGDFI